MILLLLDFDRTLFDLSRFMHDEENATLGSDYLFEDANRLLKRLPASVTPAVISQATIMGNDLRKGVDWQHRKFSFAPALAQLPFCVTTMNKGFNLAAGVKPAKDGRLMVNVGPIQGVFEKVILVDDNAWSFKPLVAVGSKIVMYHLKRSGGKHSDREAPKGVERLTSLDELQAKL